MALRLTAEQHAAIARHGEQAYPHECCGVLLGGAGAGAREVAEVVPMRNANTESPRNRFDFDPKEHLAVQRQARERGLDVIGFYHSHPDHPARPSGYDREHAFPWYSYVIISVEAGKPGTYTSWMLREDRSEFDEEFIEVLRTAVSGEATAIAEGGREV